MQYKEIFFKYKNGKNHKKNFDISNIFAQNIDCGYKIEPPRCGFNKYPQSIFWIKIKKKKVYPCKPHFYCIY